MSFPRDAYPYTNFHELNLGYFITHFREIFSQWADLYDQMTDWKDATDEELATWKTGVEADLDQREAALRAELETWKAQTGQDIAGWEDATLEALTAWQTATQAVFEAIRVEAAGSASAAAASAGDAATAKTAAETAQAAAEAAAASIASSAAQIATNTGDIADLKTQLTDLSENEYEYKDNPFFYTDFKNERYNTGSGSTYPSNNRLLNNNKTTLENDAFIVCNNTDLRFLLYYFDASGNYTSNSGWVSKLFVEKGKIFTVEIKRNTETADDLDTSNAEYIVVNILKNDYLSPKTFNAVESGVCNIANFQDMINYAIQYKYNIKLDSDFDFNFVANSTIQNPTRILIKNASGLTIDGDGHAVTMKGLTKEYLDSIDDSSSSGKDIFTLFSFVLCERCFVKNIKINGEYVYNTTVRHRYESPRQKGIAITGSKYCCVEDCVFDGMFGNAVNVNPSSSDFDGQWKESEHTIIKSCTASNCMENCFNSMGGTIASVYDGVYCFDAIQGIETAGYNENVPKYCTIISNSFFKNVEYALALNGRATVDNSIVTDSGVICGESFCGIISNTLFVTHRSIRVNPGSSPEFVGCRFYKSNLSWVSPNPRAIDAVGTEAKPINAKIRSCTFNLSTVLNLYFSYASVDIADSNFVGGTEITIYSYLPTGDVKITNSTYSQLYGEWTINNNAEATTNKVTTIDASSTDSEYPTAKAVYDFVTSLLG